MTEIAAFVAATILAKPVDQLFWIFVIVFLILAIDRRWVAALASVPIFIMINVAMVWYRLDGYIHPRTVGQIALAFVAWAILLSIGCLVGRVILSRRQRRDLRSPN